MAAQSFALDIEKFTKKTGARMDLVIRKVSLELLTKIIARTPVDTGRARANWQVSLNGPPSGQVDSIFEGAGALPGNIGAILIGHQLSQINGHTTVYIANNVPYILRLEDGYSGQAPSGMVAVTVTEYPFIVRRANSEAKSETR